MNTCDRIISDLELHSSRINKEDIIKANIDNTELFEGFQLALSPFITFGLKQIPERSGTDGPGYSWDSFKINIQKLISREITGNAARELVQDIMDHCTNVQWNNWYRRILMKDLKCGVSEKTINKIKKNAIPLFECMLAFDGLNHESKIKGKKLLEPKLDGVRVITIINAGNKTVTQYSRNGKVLENFKHITQSLEKHIDLFDRSLVLDGEMISSSFQSLMKQVHRKDNVQSSDARLMLFDILPLSEFLNGKSIMGQRRRSNLLRSMKKVFDLTGTIDIIPQTEIDLDSYVGELEFKQFNQDAIDQGFEGILIKEPDAVYECKRSTSWLKVKPSLTVDLVIVGFEEGTGKNVGKLGALICEGTDQNKIIKTNVGSGLTDEQRNEIWQDKDNVLGQIVEIRADCLTKNQDSDDVWSLRFPRFEKFRGFKAGDKI